MRALVTGATGFVGRHLVAHLAASGDEVTRSEAEITEPEALEADFSQCRPEAVYHLAAQADVGASFTDPAATLRVNVLRATTGWRPEVPVEQTLDDLLDHWRSEATGSELSQSPNSCGGGTPTGSEVPHLHDSQ